jgi:hypothetical protein
MTMPLSVEQQKHLEANWQNIQMRSNDAAALKQNELIGIARAKNNSAAIPLAYSDAALHRLESTVHNQLEWTLHELESMGVVIDDQTESFVLKHFNIMTSMNMPLSYPPGLTATMNLSAHQSSHSMARQRLNNQLQREAHAAVKSLKLRACPSQSTVPITVHISNSPGARNYIHAVDNSSIYTQVPEEIGTLMAALSREHSDLNALAEQVHRAPDTHSMAERASKWLSVASSIEALGEKLHAAAPTIGAWIHRLGS